MMRRNIVGNFMSLAAVLIIVANIVIFAININSNKDGMGTTFYLPSLFSGITFGILIFGIGELIKQAHFGFGEVIMTLKKIREELEKKN